MCGSQECLGINPSELDCDSDVDVFHPSVADELLVESLPPKLRRIIRSYIVTNIPDKAFDCDGCLERGEQEGRAAMRREREQEPPHVCPPSAAEVLQVSDGLMPWSEFLGEFDRYLELEVADVGGHLKKYRNTLRELTTLLKEHDG